MNMNWTKGVKPKTASTANVDLGAQRAAAIAAQHGEARVVLSFGARGGGAYFARWLRWQIMQAKGLSKPNHVYLDTVALAEVPATSFAVVDARKPWLTGIASFNGGWRAYYRNAIMQAKVMIFVGTREWCSSPWCKGEYDYFRLEAARRLQEGLTPLRGIALKMPGCSESFPGLVSLVPRQELVDPRHDDYWHLDGQSLLRLMQQIGRV
jgi:hypothetical protein